MFFQQLRLLLWKNFILRKRHWVSFHCTRCCQSDKLVFVVNERFYEQPVAYFRGAVFFLALRFAISDWHHSTLPPMQYVLRKRIKEHSANGT